MKKQKSAASPPPPASLFSRKKIGLLLVFLAFLGLSFWLARLPVIFVLNNHSGVFLASSYKFGEDDPSHPRLQLLRQQEHLDQVIAAGKTQFEKIVLLRRWAHQQWESHGERFYYPPWDAVEILDLYRKYGNRGFCAQFAVVFLQACQSMGLHARYVELPSHFIVGVWSDDYNRWVLMDPTADTHFERNGSPMGGARLCDAYWKNDLKGIREVKSDGTKTPVTRKDLEVYRLYSIVKRADQLAHPPWVQVNGAPMRLLTHESDYRRYPLIGRDSLTIGSPYLAWRDGAAREHFKDKPESSDPDDFHYVMNQTLIFVARRYSKKGLAKIILIPEDSPSFQDFMVNINNQGWAPVQARELFWTLKPGVNRLLARIRTKPGWEGSISSISVYFKPNCLSPEPKNPEAST